VKCADGPAFFDGPLYGNCAIKSGLGELNKTSLPGLTPPRDRQRHDEKKAEQSENRFSHPPPFHPLLMARPLLIT
jgi:hypothetical protein